MFFIDLNKLKIVKEFNFQNFEVNVAVDVNHAAAATKARIKEACAELFVEKPAIAACYVINLEANDVTEEDFISLINMSTIAFFETFVQVGGRARERRLDIPESLQCAHVSAGLLKRAVNTKTVTDVFNLMVKCGDFYYILVDSKNSKETIDNE